MPVRARCLPAQYRSTHVSAYAPARGISPHAFEKSGQNHPAHSNFIYNIRCFYPFVNASMTFFDILRRPQTGKRRAGMYRHGLFQFHYQSRLFRSNGIMPKHTLSIRWRTNRGTHSGQTHDLKNIHPYAAYVFHGTGRGRNSYL